MNSFPNSDGMSLFGLYFVRRCDEDTPMTTTTPNTGDTKMTTQTRYAEDRGNHFQSGINAQFELTRDAERCAAEVREMAALTHQTYPQYAGHWNGEEWRPAVITQRFDRHGVSFEKGDITIAKREGTICPQWVAYSSRRGVDCALPSSVRFLDD